MVQTISGYNTVRWQDNKKEPSDLNQAGGGWVGTIKEM